MPLPRQPAWTHAAYLRRLIPCPPALLPAAPSFESFPPCFASPAPSPQLRLRLPFTLQSLSAGQQVSPALPQGAVWLHIQRPSSRVPPVHSRGTRGWTSSPVVGMPGMTAERGMVSVGLVAGSSRMHTAAAAQSTLGDQAGDPLPLGHLPLSGPTPRRHPGALPLAWEEAHIPFPSVMVQCSGYAAHRSVAWGKKKTFTRKRFHKIKYTCLFQGHTCNIAKQGRVEHMTVGSRLGHGTQLHREKPVSYSSKLERTRGRFQYKHTSHTGQGPGSKAAPLVPSLVPHALG